MFGTLGDGPSLGGVDGLCISDKGAVLKMKGKVMESSVLSKEGRWMDLG